LRRAFTLQIVVAIILLAVQIVLGGLTVLKLLEPTIVSAHLTNALMFFTVLIWMATRAKALADEPELRPRYPVTPLVRNLFIVGTGLIFIQTALGGMVATTHSGLVCPDFPTCHGDWIPPTILPLWLQMSHRYVAFGLLALAVVLAFAAARLPLGRLPRNGARWFPWLVLAQIGLGLVNIVFQLPTWAQVTHLGNAVLMFTLLLLSTIEVIEAATAYKEPWPVNPAAASWRRPYTAQS
jgi:cytochrome c oxidase assembly protein subunit 15